MTMPDLLSLSFDVYQRYKIVSDVIDGLRRDGQPMRILDAGGAGSLLGTLLEKDSVLLLDRETERRPGEFIGGDVTALPFRDSSFDYAVSVDVCEHLPSDRRQPYLAELRRVSRHGIIVAAPFDSPEVAHAERLVSACYQELYGERHRWLDEHVTLGLPKLDEIQSHLRASGDHLTTIPNGYLPHWLAGITLQVLWHRDPKLQQLYEEVCRFYNGAFYAYDNREPCYRYVLVATRHRVTLDLGTHATAGPPPQMHPAPSEPLTVVAPLLHAVSEASTLTSGRGQAVIDPARLRLATLDAVANTGALLVEDRGRWKARAEQLARDLDGSESRTAELVRDRDVWKEQTGQLRQECERLKQEAQGERAAPHHMQARLAEIERGVAWSFLTSYRQLRLRAIPLGSRRDRLYRAALDLLPAQRQERSGRPRFSTRVKFRWRRVNLLARTSYTILRTQGAGQLGRHVSRYVKQRLTGAPAGDGATVMDEASTARPLRRRVAIVIPTHKQTRLVADCVSSIQACLSPPSSGLVRIIVVDDGSGDEVCEYLKQLPAVVKCLDKNQGFARAVNAGIEMTHSDEDVVVLNNDTLAKAGWIEALQHCAYGSEYIGVVGAKLLYPDGRIQSAGSYRSVGAPEWFDHCFRFQAGDHLPANIRREVLAVTGACMYIKREVLTRIGSFNPAFAMAFEDVDYCLRAREAGYQIVYCPAATLTHLEGYTRGERKEAREVDSQEYFWNTWRAHFDGRRFTNSRDRLRVLYVLQDTGIAGGHKVVFEHLNGLAARGYEAELYSLAHSPKWFRLNVPVRTFRDYRALLAALSQQDAIKVATWWETGEVVWRAALQKGAAAYLVQDIETSYYRPQEHKERARVIASYRKEFHYLTDAGWTRQQLAGHGVDACVVSPGIDLSIFKPLGLERRRDVVLSIGRSHPLKNIDFLLRAFPRLRSKASLHLFGIEPSIGRGLTSRYVVNPSDNGIAELYNQATVFMLPSRHEGYALPILEAMACGCPVICTNANGNMDFCRDGENCLIVPHDDDARLAETLDLLLDNPQLQETLRAGGLATARQYTWDRALDVLDDFYREVARDRSRYAATASAHSAAESVGVSE